MLTRSVEDIKRDLDAFGGGFGLYGEAAEAIHELIAERDRLLNGEFKAEQVHNICRNLFTTVPATEFAPGCALEQRKLYGCAPDTDKLRNLRLDVLCCVTENDLYALRRSVRVAVNEEIGK